MEFAKYEGITLKKTLNRFFDFSEPYFESGS